MTDEQLIAALGWQPCEWKRNAAGWYCKRHDDGGYAMHPECCAVLFDELVSARAGIDLARQGIADRLSEAAVTTEDERTVATDVADGVLAWAATLAREWQP